ncbi:hypothetical protein BJV74DRAFT_792362 [Russula compacta]|nr:hypothetical protein BJV74DRAFT_792362 [Russula compacta]
MATNPIRLARLTLYSGTNCSLCDVAKAELAKIRQTRNFELNIVNIQDPGQEHWRKTYAYWIPALHIDGKEVAKGPGSMGENLVQDSGGQFQETVITDRLLFSDKQGNLSSYSYLSFPPVYERCNSDILGAGAEEGLSSVEGISHCFNCGSTHHLVPSCPTPYNTELIALSRQMYNFFRLGRPAEQITISDAAEFKHQRRQWIDSFEPGQVQGPLLREALGLNDDGVSSDPPWLKNMVDWGYPSGWFSEDDPRAQILRHIDSLFVETLDVGEGDHSLTIFGDDAVEVLDISALHVPPVHKYSRREDPDRSQDPRNSPVIRFDPAEQIKLRCGRRWATYPSTYFSSDLLPVYNGTRLPPLLPTTSSTFTSERHLLWERILHDADRTRIRGQDIENVSQHHHSSPPPPIILPPPLPPLPHPAAAADSEADDGTGTPSRDGESDMDLSDCDS